MSKLNCQNAYFYALTQAGLSNASALRTATMLAEYTQSSPFYWPQSTCANATFVGSSSLFGGYKPSDSGVRNVAIVCDFPREPQVASLDELPINFYDKTATATYVNPINACDLPIWTKSEPLSGASFEAELGVGCYCRF
jgi:hypothetical protein